MPDFVLPDYNNCILNIMSSFLKHYNAGCGYSSNKILDNILTKQYRNVVFMVFDGMGTNILRDNLHEDSFLAGHISATVTSVFPCTTTAATTSYYSGISPNEHGWLGWSLYFKEYGRMIDIFSNQDSFTFEQVGGTHAAYSIMPYETVYEKIDSACAGKLPIYTLMPSKISFSEHPNKNIKIDNVEELCGNIKSLCSDKQNKFIMSYWFEPDKSMHSHGCHTDYIKTILRKINSLVEEMCIGLKDTLVVISADHGLVDINEEIYLDDVPEIDECLIMPPSVETRAASLFIKPEMKAVFEERFENLFGDRFRLFKKDEFMKNQLLGLGTTHRKVNEFIGDYMACATGHSLFRYKTANSKDNFKYNGHHAGLCEDEMLVPLIIAECN